LVAYLALDWTVKAALIAGTALSSTSLAVIYAVLAQDGLNETDFGRLLMSATLVTDVGTAIAQSAIFIQPNLWFPVLLVGSIALVMTGHAVLPRSSSA
jgi:Kef-type K+ transport system membrane component KefB